MLFGIEAQMLQKAVLTLRIIQYGGCCVTNLRPLDQKSYDIMLKNYFNQKQLIVED